jgi:putative membrane protein
MKAQTRREPWTFTEIFFLVALLFWSSAGLIFTLGRLTPASIGHFLPAGNLRDFVDLCIMSGDTILILLAFINTHLHAARQWTGGVARRWAFTIVSCAYIIETIGTITGIPFGDYHYVPDKFGPMIAYVPLTIPLAWHVIVTNALFLVRAVAPHVGATMEALAAGLICMFYDFILEPFATIVKGYWIWGNGSVPLLNYVSWFVLSALLVRAFAPTLSTRFRFDPRPLIILVLTVLIFLAGEAAARFYR